MGLAALVAVACPAGAAAATQPVNALFAEFSPTLLDVLPGETVEWTNVGERRHTVTADDGSFDSGDTFEPGARFSRTFDAVGAYPYHCQIHPGMVGEVDVRRVTLAALPSAAVPAGNPVELSGRTADPGQTITIQRDSGSGFEPVGAAMPAPDGTWRTSVTAQATGDYRAVLGTDTSETRRLVVSDRRIAVRATRRGVAVTVTPALPFGRVVLLQHLRERFGWWPAARGTLDYLSRAEFRLRGPARLRVALVDRNGWTALVTSPELSLRARRGR
jgi:plastocyanin